MTMSKERMRAEFEEWCAGEGYPTSFVANATDEHGNPVHTDPRTHAAWFAWQEVRERLAPALKSAEEALVSTLYPAGEWPAALKTMQRKALADVRLAQSQA